jgi:hypothetical protein
MMTAGFTFVCIAGVAVGAVVAHHFVSDTSVGCSPRKIELFTAAAGCLFALAHLLMSIMVAMATYVGANPACATATLANDFPSCNGLLAISYAMVIVGCYTFLITPAVPYHLTDAGLEELTGKDSPDQPTGLPAVGKIGEWGEWDQS